MSIKYDKEIEAKRIARQINKKNREKNKQEAQDEFSDARFAFIVGYTSGGAAYGVTHEEMYGEEINDFEEIFKD